MTSAFRSYVDSIGNPDTEVFVDIGANFGTDSIHAVRNGFKRVLALDPDCTNFDLLQTKALLNHVDDCVTCGNLAISNVDGIVEMKLSPSNFGDHSIRMDGISGKSAWDEGHRCTRTVRVSRLGKVLDEEGRYHSSGSIRRATKGMC